MNLNYFFLNSYYSGGVRRAAEWTGEEDLVLRCTPAYSGDGRSEKLLILIFLSLYSGHSGVLRGGVYGRVTSRC